MDWSAKFFSQGVSDVINCEKLLDTAKLFMLNIINCAVVLYTGHIALVKYLSEKTCAVML